MRHRHEYHHDLELALLERHVSEAHVVGKIDGLVMALAEINDLINHSTRFGFVEIDAQGGLEAGLAALFPDDEARPAGEWVAAVREALTRVAIEEGAVEAWSVHIRRPLGRIVDEIVYLLGVLLVGDDPVQAWYLMRRPGARGNGVYGYISDATLVLTAGDRAYILGLGWSD